LLFSCVFRYRYAIVKKSSSRAFQQASHQGGRKPKLVAMPDGWEWRNYRNGDGYTDL